MFCTIVITAIITMLAMLVLFLLKENRTAINAYDLILTQLDDLTTQVRNRNTREHKKNIEQAYDDGLQDGRGTDMLYKQCLRKYLSQEQPNIMMNGEKGESHE